MYLSVDIPELVVPIRMFLDQIKGCCKQAIDLLNGLYYGKLLLGLLGDLLKILS
jgi:hypothetical protein